MIRTKTESQKHDPHHFLLTVSVLACISHRVLNDQAQLKALVTTLTTHNPETRWQGMAKHCEILQTHSQKQHSQNIQVVPGSSEDTFKHRQWKTARTQKRPPEAPNMALEGQHATNQNNAWNRKPQAHAKNCKNQEQSSTSFAHHPSPSHIFTNSVCVLIHVCTADATDMNGHMTYLSVEIVPICAHPRQCTKCESLPTHSWAVSLAISFRGIWIFFIEGACGFFLTKVPH